MFCFCFLEEYRIRKNFKCWSPREAEKTDPGAEVAVFGIFFSKSKRRKQKDDNFHANLQLQINKLTSVFLAFVLLLTVNFALKLKLFDDFSIVLGIAQSMFCLW